MNYAIALVIGLLAGLHTSTWGMYKDAPHEGFTWPKYFRSTIVSTVLAVITQNVIQWDLHDAGNRFVFWA